MSEKERRMKERDIQRGETRLIKKERKRRIGETASDDATGEGVEARQHRERGFRGVRKPSRRAVEEERANKRAVEERERERLSRGAPGERRDRFESKETRDSSRAEGRDVIGERERVRLKTTPRKRVVEEKRRGVPERESEG